MWLLEREAERSGRLKDLKSVIGTKYGQEAAATARCGYRVQAWHNSKTL